MLNVLLINDDPNKHDMFKKLYHGMFNITSIYNAYDGMHKLKSSHDLIILKLLMPKMSGLALINVMTEEERKKTLVISESLDDGEIMVKLIKLGIHHFIESNASVPEMKRELENMGILKGWED